MYEMLIGENTFLICSLRSDDSNTQTVLVSNAQRSTALSPREPA